MVEGPGCKLKGEKLKTAAVGQKVLGVRGNVIDNRPKWATDKQTDFHQFVGKEVTDVKTLGKELFLIFDFELCLRIHFLMDGSVSYNNQLGGFERRNKVPPTPRLELTLSRDIVGFYSCSVERRDKEKTLERWRTNISLDICWHLFDGPRAADIILSEGNSERIVADVVMDQDIMPGVGNIIKNEGCFDAGINPLTQIKDLTREHVVLLVKMLRDFSLLFYDCRKTGKALAAHYKMYRFSSCKTCGGRVTKCKPGEYQRGTYFCAACQDNNLTAGPARTSNSLLGWARPGLPWTCQVCTLTNKPGSLRCSVCGHEKAAKPGGGAGGGAGGGGGTKRKSSDSLPLPLSDESKKVKLEPNMTSPSQSLTVTKTVGKFSFTFKSRKEKEIVLAESSLNTPDPKPTVIEHLRPPTDPLPELCKGHQKPCVKKTVSKEGPNKLRLFWTCSLSKVKSCGHFSWADLHHPRCKHGEISLLREVYKLNENNGREFFICPKAKKDQCDFFQWKL